jgi:hypothetical protein
VKLKSKTNLTKWKKKSKEEELNWKKNNISQIEIEG